MDREILVLVLCMVPVGVAFGAGFQVFRRWRKSQRSLVYEQLCRDLPLHPCEPERGGIPELVATTQHVRGECDGYDVRVFENVSDLVEPGGSTAVRTHILLAKPGWRYPPFLIEPRSMATNWRQKIDQRKGLFFPKDEAFTTSCFVDGPDHAAIRAALTPKAMRLLRGNRRVYVDCRGDALLFYESEILLSPRGVERLFALALDFAEAMAEG